MSKALVSIVYYSEEASIKKAVDSIEKYTDAEMQMIIVRNGGDINPIEDLASEYRNIRILEMKKNVGFGAGHNAAFNESGEKYDQHDPQAGSCKFQIGIKVLMILYRKRKSYP